MRIEYTKHSQRTSKLVPTGAFLGEGAYGKVFLHRRNQEWAVKKSFQSMDHEYSIGESIRSIPTCVKVHDLFIKTYAPWSKKYKLVMDYIPGKTLDASPEFDDRTIRILMKEAIDTALKLFDLGIYWDDIHPGNMYVTPEGHLMLADFDFWKKSDNPDILAKKILDGLVRMLDFLNSQRRNKNLEGKLREIIRSLKESITDPKTEIEKYGTEILAAVDSFTSSFQVPCQVFG